ncbi:MAG TPA: GNAT family N-acetyltransferase [Spirochaetota bacterium]|nr:GNAT family N-acetyltransferase [Spirochaetota bacterium]
MKIVLVKDYELLWKISRMVDTGKIESVNYTADEFFRYLIDRQDANKIQVIVALEGKEILGFGVYSIHHNIISGKDTAFIDVVYIDPTAPKDCGPQMLERVEEFARQHKLDEIGCYSKKRERGMWAKYGFVIDYTVYKKKLGGNDGIIQ